MLCLKVVRLEYGGSVVVSGGESDDEVVMIGGESDGEVVVSGGEIPDSGGEVPESDNEVVMSGGEVPESCCPFSLADILCCGESS